MWDVIWLAVAAAAILLIMVLTISFVGRGQLGADQTESHYLDEVEARSHFRWA